MAVLAKAMSVCNKGLLSRGFDLRFTLGLVRVVVHDTSRVRQYTSLSQVHYMSLSRVHYAKEQSKKAEKTLLRQQARDPPYDDLFGPRSEVEV